MDQLASMIPDLRFYTSPAYEKRWLKFCKGKIPQIDDEAFQKIVKQVKARKELFNHYLMDMTQILDINWTRKEIEIWLVSLRIGCFSSPLTISCSTMDGKPRDIEHIIDELTHELIHNAISQQVNYSNAIKKLREEYPTELPVVHEHILIHAVHSLIYRQKRGVQREDMDIQYSQSNPPYAKSWDIVQREGAKNILEKYFQIKVNYY